MNISWKGDFANAPKTGVVVSEASEMLTIKWSDGSQSLVPAFTVSERYGWKRW